MGKRVKIFNKLLKEFLDDYKRISDKEYNFKADNAAFLNCYREEVKFVSDRFFKRDSLVFENISLCKKMDLPSTDLGDNKEIVWKYLHNLYIVTLETNKEKEEATLSKFNKGMSEDTQFSGLVKDIASQVSKSFEGKDLSKINPMELISGLMSGQSTMGGIDFTEILNTTNRTIQNKVESGELDVSVLKKQAESFMKSV